MRLPIPIPIISGMANPGDTIAQQQLHFNWISGDAVPAPPAPSPVARQPKLGTSKQLAGVRSTRLTKKPRLRDVLEKILRDRSIPYVDVAESRRALSGRSRLRLFHFVVYRHPVPNWLVFAATADKQVRSDLRQWEKIFGEDFVAVIAKEVKDGSMRFHTLAGQDLTLSGVGK